MDPLHARKTICMLVMNAMDVMDDPRVRREAEAATQAGYGVLVITRSFDPGLSTVERRNGFSVIRVRNFLPRIFTPRRNAPTILKELETLLHASIANFQIGVQALKQKAAIYHAHEIGALPVGYLLKRIRGAKLVYDAHELYTETSSLREASRWFRWIFEQVERYILRRVDAVITASEMRGQEMVARYKCERPLVVRNCPSLIQGVEVKGDPLRKVLGLDKNQKIVLYQGLYSAYRGLEQLVEGARFIQDGVVVFRGWGGLEGELKRLTNSLGLNNKVFFLEPSAATELVRAAAEADIGVVPYLPVNLNNKYSTPNKLFEYMMAGLAIAASDLPEIGRIIEETGSGVLFDPYDPKSIGSAINRLISDEELLRSAQSNARRAAKEKYNWEKESQKLLNLYETLLADG